MEAEKTNPPTMEEGVLYPKAYDGFEWIVDENMLRDEGVIYGLSGSDAAEKLKTIELYYQQQASTLGMEADQYVTKANDLDIHKGKLLKELEEAIQAFRKLEEESHHKHNEFARKVIGILTYTAAVISAFCLIYSWLKSKLEYPLLASIGAYVFGGLNLFSSTSFLFESSKASETGKREDWKILVEELVVPFVVVLFVVIWGYNGQEIAYAVTFGLFLYALFLFSGRGLLSNITGLMKEVQGFLQRKKHKRLIVSRTQEQRDVIEKLQSTITETDKSINAYMDKKRELELRSAELLELARTRQAYFLSEFWLARATRNQLSTEHLMQLSAYRKS